MSFEPVALDADLELGVLVEPLGYRVRLDSDRQAFWDRVARGTWEPQTFQVLDRHLDPSRAYIDIGAWIGPTTLYAARTAARVSAFEPDPIAFAELSANVAANPAFSANVQLHPEAVSVWNGAQTLYAGGMYWSGVSRFGDSMSSLFSSGAMPGQSAIEVGGVRLVDFMEAQAVHDCSLIKMDVEGGEFSLIPGHWRDLAAFGMPTLYVAFHAPAPAEREALIGGCFEELRSCYAHLTPAAPADDESLDELMAEAIDWTDETPGSPWRRLERLLGDGLVAANAPPLSASQP